MRNPPTLFSTPIRIARRGYQPASLVGLRAPQTAAGLARKLRSAVVLLAAAVLLSAGAQAQSNSSNKQPTIPLGQTITPLDLPGNTTSGLDPTIARMNSELVMKRNVERQRKMVEDANRLLAMATALKASVDKTTKNVLSIDVLKQADEVERLAKSVKEKMRADM